MTKRRSAKQRRGGQAAPQRSQQQASRTVTVRREVVKAEREVGPSAGRLRELFAGCGMRLSEAQVAQFWDFHQLLRRRNEELDLTRLHGFETIVLKHYVDCALVATLVDLPSPLLDLGTGAGFPGIPLKIVRPDLQLILAEPRAKRVAFLEEAVQTLRLRDVEIVPQRIGVGFDRPVRGVITRAVASIPATLSRLEPWLAPGALALFMKGPGVDDELADVPPTFRLRRDIPYSIPGTPHARRLVVLERTTVEPVETVSDRYGSDVLHLDFAGEVRPIQSEANPTLKLLRAALSGRGIRKHGRALMSGLRPVLEVLRDFPERAVAWVTSDATPPPPSPAPDHLVWLRVAPALFKELDSAGTGGPLLWIEVPPLEPWSDADWPAGCTLFVPFQDPENVGAVLRSAAAFGVARAVLLQEAAHPFHPRSARAAGSALLRVPLFQGPAIADLEVKGAPLLPLATAGRDVGEFAFPARFGLLPGLEGPGLPDARRTPEALAIPMQPGNESLNAAVATAIALYIWSRRRL